MEYSKQKLRRSQFVLVYGPGSIIEGPNGSRLMPSLEGLGEDNCNDAFFTKYEIKDVRMSHMLNKESEDGRYECHFISIPSNDSIDDDEPRVIYSTVMFPSWHLCHKRNPSILYFHNIYDEHCQAYDEKKCTDCDKENNPNVRFVRACPDGHLDEVYWDKEVHGDDKTCKNSDYFYWISAGSSLEDIIIQCPFCGSKTDMQNIYRQKRRCTARIPENEQLNGSKVLVTRPERSFECGEEMSVIQKQSSSLRLPYTRTLLKIPTFDESILNIFNNSHLKVYLDTLEDNIDVELFSKDKFLKGVFKYLDNEDFWKVEDYLQEHEISDFFEEFRRMGSRDVSFSNAVDEELKGIRYGEKESANFSRSDFFPYTLKGLDYEFPLNVCAIEKLTTVTAQLSYQRKPHPKKDKKSEEIIKSEFISVGYLDEDVDPNKMWYPAFMGVGEGIFITSDENPFNYNLNLDETINKWETCEIDVSYDERPETKNPLFIWWHTLSHAIIKSLSLSCGYSAASLHERVYLDEDSEKGGILIYNTSPGDDSGMGGLVDLVYNKKEFDKVLKNALNSLLVCSNDPLCSSVELEDGGVNGSACHNCLLVSETSCEHQNSLLDRNFFIN